MNYTKKFYNTANLDYSAIFILYMAVFQNKSVKKETRDT